MSCCAGTSPQTSSIHKGATAPYAVKFDISTAETDFDLSTVVSATIAVTRGDGTAATWGCVLLSQSATALTIKHVMNPGDVPETDTLKLVPTLALAFGQLVCEPVELCVS